MRKSTISVTMPFNKELLWNIVTDNAKTEWRSDLSKVDILNENEFVEHTTKDIKTKFTITAKEDLEYYEFEFGNDNMSGVWHGKFFEVDKNMTQLVFTEEIQIKNPILELLSYLFFPIKKNQKKYMEDLKKEAERLLQ
ncbi:MAG: hypothetical protein HDT41_04720 [Lachnospiraceae bacterium]|nr:hypothetical protein [Lachnospiraceae bacterium]